MNLLKTNNNEIMIILYYKKSKQLKIITFPWFSFHFISLVLLVISLISDCYSFWFWCMHLFHSCLAVSSLLFIVISFLPSFLIALTFLKSTTLRILIILWRIQWYWCLVCHSLLLCIHCVFIGIISLHIK